MMTPAHYASRSLGFTLIELLVAVSVGVLMTGMGIASFLRFNDRQTLVTAGNEVVGALRSTQKKARAGVKLSDCNQLLHYQFVGIGAQNRYVIRAVCKPVSGANIVSNVQTKYLPESVEFSVQTYTNFRVLDGGVTGTTTITLLDGANNRFVIDIDAGGAISDGKYNP